MVMLQLRQITVPPGQRIELANIDWEEFEAILHELGEHRNTRIAYSHCTLSIVTPQFQHEKTKVVIGDLVKVLLEELGIDYDASGSTTLKRQDLGKGVEPDDSFYIQNFAAVLLKDRIDLSVDPPPDLAIEIDLTSKTDIGVYTALGIPELWRYDGGSLRIDSLQNGQYVQVKNSPTFPDWPIVTLVAQYVSRARAVGQGRAIREFRQSVQNTLRSPLT